MKYEAVRDHVLGYTIPKGWKVLVWFRSVHDDPQTWPDPKKFDPSRWNVRPHYIYMYVLHKKE